MRTLYVSVLLLTLRPGFPVPPPGPPFASLSSAPVDTYDVNFASAAADRLAVLQRERHSEA
jgi:hypothetical protein